MCSHSWLGNFYFKKFPYVLLVGIFQEKRKSKKRHNSIANRCSIIDTRLYYFKTNVLDLFIVGIALSCFSGGEHTEEAWINLIYWLKGKGATNFVVLVEKFPTKQRVSQLLNRLLADKKIIVSFKLLKNLISIEDATQLMEETSQVAPIDSVFFMSLVVIQQVSNDWFSDISKVNSKINFLTGL